MLPSVFKNILQEITKPKTKNFACTKIPRRILFYSRVKLRLNLSQTNANTNPCDLTAAQPEKKVSPIPSKDSFQHLSMNVNTAD